MPIQVLMPALSPTMTEGNLARWLKSEGDSIAPGDVIAEIETDKATMEVEAVDEGTLGKILVPEGSEDVAVNTPIAVILEDGESADDIGDVAAPAAKVAPAGAETPDVSDDDEDAGRVSVIKEASAPPPDVDYDGETAEMTVREALRDAMAE